MPRIAFAGNRPIGVDSLRMLLKAGLKPVLLLVAAGEEAEGAEAMEDLLPGTTVLRGKVLKTPEALEVLRRARPDYLLSIHYPYIIPPLALAAVTIGTLNLHPAFLPWNRGWHTPTWAIAEGTPYGATLHWVDSGMDTGDIALQKEVKVLPGDTAHTLYQRALRAEREVLEQALPLLMKNALPRIPQEGAGTSHTKKDIAAIQNLALSDGKPARDVLKILRALTTNRPEEAAYVEEGGRRYGVRVEVVGE